MTSRPTDRVHIFGASGSGTTTLGAALAARLGQRHLDTDDFFWLPTERRFSVVRPADERDALMTAAFDAQPRYVLSGSMSNFGAHFFPRFTLAIWVTLPQAVRMARLEARERQRHGGAFDTDPETIAQNDAFMDWARQYDEGGLKMRSFAVHQRVFADFPSLTLRLDGEMTTEAQVARVLMV